MKQYKYMVMDESWNARKRLYHIQKPAEEFARQKSIESARSDITVFVLSIPSSAQPNITTEDDVNQFVDDDWRVVKSYYHGRADRKGRFKTKSIVKHEPRMT